MVKVIVQRSPICPGVQAPDGDSGEPTFVFRSAVSGKPDRESKVEAR